MARLRPARTCRTPNSQSWSRYSLKKPRKNFVRAMPHKSILVFNMGKNKEYDMKMQLCTKDDIQIRSNSLESARQTANKYLESKLPENYIFKVLVYPHNVIREHKMATGAGADRISQGMSLSFGKPVSVAARMRKNQPLFMVMTNSKNNVVVREAFRRAASKLSGHYSVKVS
jgi:large subunit ribosomal protein L10e